MTAETQIKRAVSGIARRHGLLAIASALLPAVALTFYQEGWIGKAAVDWIVNLISEYAPLRRFVISSNIPKQSRVYYAFALPQIPLFLIFIIRRFRESAWFGTPYTEKQKKWSPIAALVSFAVGVIALMSFEGQSTRYFALGDSWEILALFGWVPFMAFAILLGSAISLVRKQLSHKENRSL